MKPRLAFTLIELLVVIAIVGVIVGITIPAVGKVRETANRARCANNLRNIGIAALTYQEQHRQLPVAILMPYAKRGNPPDIIDIASSIPPLNLINDSNSRLDSDPTFAFGPNWAVYLLPFLGEDNLYRQANISDYLVGYSANNAAQRDRWRDVVKSQQVKLYTCPSDRNDGVPFEGYSVSLLPVPVSPPLSLPPLGLPPFGVPPVAGLNLVPVHTPAPGPWARGNYAANAGPGWWPTSFEGDTYPEIFGTTGPVMGINFGTATNRIKDGAGFTVMLSELRAGVSAKDPRGAWAMGFPGSSVTAANAIGDCQTPNDSSETSDDLQGCPDVFYSGIGFRDHMGCNTGFLDLGFPSWQAQSRSMHTGGINACFADGSVRFISNYINQKTWFAMLSTSDGAAYKDD